MPVVLTCAVCERPFSVMPSIAAAGRRFCSNSCRGRWFGGERSPHYRKVELTCERCGVAYLVSPVRATTVDGRPRRFCSNPCRQAFMKAEHAPGWKGGRFADADGYIRVWQPDHPRAFGTGHIHEHTLVAERAIGRAIRPDEQVHHVDGNKANNDPANLSVLTKSAHQKLHRELERLARDNLTK